MKAFLSLIILGLAGCGYGTNKNSCDFDAKPIGQFGSLQIPYSAFYNLDKAYNCSRQLNKPVLAIYGGYNVVSDRNVIWGVLLEDDVRSIVEDNFILAYLFVDDRTPSNELIQQSNCQAAKLSRL